MGCLFSCCPRWCPFSGKKKLASDSNFHLIDNLHQNRYEQVKYFIQPFDLILFKGADCVSKTVCCLTKSNWSHCGIVVNTDIMPIENGIPGKLYIWESTIGGAGYGPVDIETGQTFLGVQVRDLEAVVETYLSTPNTQVGWFPLKHNPLYRGYLPCYQKEIMKNLYEDYKGRLYQFNCCYTLGAVFNSLRKCRVLTSCCKQNVFCSELVAFVYIALGVFPGRVDPSDVTPGEFLTDFGSYFSRGTLFVLY